MFIRYLVVCCSAMSAAATDLAAPDPAPELVTDRPDQTESAAVVPPGLVQIESGVIYREGPDDARAAEFGGTLLRTGLTNRVELRLATAGWQRLLDEDRQGSGDAELGFKARLWDEDGIRPEGALLWWVSVPVGNQAFSSDRFDPGFRFSMSHSLSPRLSLGYNAGIAWSTEQSPVRTLRSGAEPRLHTSADFEYTLSLGMDLTERLGAFVEVFGSVPLNAGDGPAHSMDGGFTYLLRPNVQWDISGGAGLTKDADHWFAGTGISVRFPR